MRDTRFAGLEQPANKEVTSFKNGRDEIIGLELFGKDGTMGIVKLSVLFAVCAGMVVINGCVSDQQYKDLRVQNNTQRKRIAELESEVQITTLKLEQLKRGFDAIKSRSGIESESLQQQITALNEDLGRKKALIASMRQQLLYGGVQLPVELSTALEDFAKGAKMVTYDSSRGIVKFESDLLLRAAATRFNQERSQQLSRYVRF